MIDFVFFSQNISCCRADFLQWPCKVAAFKKRFFFFNLPVPFIILLISQIDWVCKNCGVVVKAKIIMSPIYPSNLLRCEFREPAAKEDLKKKKKKRKSLLAEEILIKLYQHWHFFFKHYLCFIENSYRDLGRPAARLLLRIIVFINSG